MLVDTDKLKEFIVNSELISRAELDELSLEATKKKQPIEEFLVSSGKIGEEDFRRVKAYLLGIPFVKLKGAKI